MAASLIEVIATSYTFVEYQQRLNLILLFSPGMLGLAWPWLRDRLCGLDLKGPGLDLELVALALALCGKPKPRPRPSCPVAGYSRGQKAVRHRPQTYTYIF